VKVQREHYCVSGKWIGNAIALEVHSVESEQGAPRFSGVKGMEREVGDAGADL